MSVRSLNEATLERLRAVDEYVRVLIEMESRLAAARMAMARARTIVGHTYASLASVDEIEDMTAAIRVQTPRAGDFVLVETDAAEEEETKGEGKSDSGLRARGKKSEKEAKEDVKDADSAGGDRKEKKAEGSKGKKKEKDDNEEEEVDEKKKKPLSSYRPYGVLEPRAAKEARTEAREAARLAVVAAGLRERILRAEERMKEEKAALPVEDLRRLMKAIAVE